jgi:hypothetical protein
MRWSAASAAESVATISPSFPISDRGVFCERFAPFGR